jgi:hypothetical protein
MESVLAREEEVRLLRKEIAWLETRRESFQHDIRMVRAGNITAYVNGIASRDYAHLMYLRRRLVRACDRLESLGATYR